MVSLDFLQFKLEAILFTFFRISGVFAVAPLFSQGNVPVHLKILLALLIALMLSPLTVSASFKAPTHLVELVVLAAQELLVGILIGSAFLLLFVGVQVAGEFIGFQIGFSIVNVVDPLTQQQISLLSTFKFIIATLVFFMVNGHHLILQALVSSYSIVPLGQATFRFPVYQEFARMSAGVFLIAVKIAAPVMATLFLTDVALGVVARTVPQMNIFIVGFPLKIFLGLFFMGATLPVFAYVFNKALTAVDIESLKLLSLLAR